MMQTRNISGTANRRSPFANSLFYTIAIWRVLHEKFRYRALQGNIAWSNETDYLLLRKQNHKETDFGQRRLTKYA